MQIYSDISYMFGYFRFDMMGKLMYLSLSITILSCCETIKVLCCLILLCRPLILAPM